MRTLEYVVKDEYGMHARPASQLVNLCKTFSSSIKITAEGKTADLKRIFEVLGMVVKHADKILITIDGEDEEEAFQKITSFISQNNI